MTGSSMNKQVIFIHGGSSYSDYDTFIACLKEESIDPFEVKEKRWHQGLAESLGDEYEVFSPRMPNADNAKYLEWKIWFEKYIQFLHDGVVLIGHSQGGYFLAKYFTENSFPVKIAALVFAAAPFEPDDFGGEDGGDFRFDVLALPKLLKITPKIVFFHSTDDFVVPYTHAQKYKESLPDAELLTFSDKNHFLIPEFPELVAYIKGLG